MASWCSGRQTVVRRAWPGGLTACEFEVLGLLARGRSNRQSAFEAEPVPGQDCL
jgi:DNA-binding CsgD family transcriptional regulator